MAVFRRIFDITKAALFALMFVFVSVFPQNTLADEPEIPNYFVMEVFPNQNDPVFTFSISAAGCYNIYWNCSGPTGACTEERTENYTISRDTSAINVNVEANVDRSLLTKTYANKITFYKRYSIDQSNPYRRRYIKIERTACSPTNWAGYSKDTSVPVIDFTSVKGGIISANMDLTGIYGSLGAVFPTLASNVIATESSRANGDISRTDAGEQPNFNQTFYGCVNLEGSIPQYLFRGITGSPTENMFANTFAGCENLTGPIPSGLFGAFDGSITSGMFNGTFFRCKNLSGDIPSGLFNGLQGILQPQVFEDTFRDCENLTGIPANLFADFGKPMFADKLTNAKDAYKNTFNGCTGIKYIYDSNDRHLHYLPKNFLGNIDLATSTTNSTGNHNITDGMFKGVPDIDDSDPNNITGIAEGGNNNSYAEGLCTTLTGAATGTNVTAYTNGVDVGLYRVSGDPSTQKLMCNVSTSSSSPVERELKFYSNCYRDQETDTDIINEYGIHHESWFPQPVSEVSPMFKGTTYDGYAVPQKQAAPNESLRIAEPPECPGYAFAGYRRLATIGGKIKDGVLHYDSLLRIKGKWQTLVENPGTDNAILYLELYADWKPKVYSITLDNRGKLQQHATLTNTSSSQIIYEKYSYGLYPQYDPATIEVSGQQITKLPVPTATGAVFKGYGKYDEETTTWTMISDENGNLLDGTPLKTSSVRNNMTYYARWEPKTLVYFMCKNKSNNLDINIGSAHVLAGSATTFPTSEFPTLNEVKTANCRGDWNNQRKALKWTCTPTNPDGVYSIGDNTYHTDKITFGSTTYSVVCRPTAAPKIYKIILDGNNGLSNSTKTIYLSGIPDWKANTNSSDDGIYQENYYTTFEDAAGTTAGAAIYGINEIPTRPNNNKYAVFSGYYDAQIDGNLKLNPLNMSFPNTQEEKSREFNTWETTWYAHYENAKTQYTFVCINGGTPVKSGYIENNKLPNDYNGVSVIGQHACLGENEDMTSYNLCHVPNDNGNNYNPNWDCTRVIRHENDNTTSVETFTYYPTTNGSNNYCPNNTIQTNGEVDSIYCVANSKPPAFTISLGKANNQSQIMYEVFGIDFYNSKDKNGNLILDKGTFSSVYAVHDEQKIRNIFYPDEEEPTSENINAITAGNHDRCENNQIFVGYYPSVEGSHAVDNETPISYGEPYINWNGEIFALPTAFDGDASRVPSCLNTGNYYLSFYCSDTNTPKLVRRDQDKITEVHGTFNAPRIDKQTASDPDNICPQQATQVNNGDWKCKVYRFAATKTKEGMQHPVEVDYHVGDDITENGDNGEEQGDWWKGVYRIDCFAQWHDNILDIKLHPGLGENETLINTDTSTQDLYSRFATNIYYNSDATGTAATTLQETESDEFIYQEPLRDMYLFDGYFDSETGNANRYIKPRRQVTDTNMSLYDSLNGRSTKDILLYTPDNTDLYAHWTPIYKINLSAPDAYNNVSTETYDAYLNAIYTDHTDIYADQLFYGGNNKLGNTNQTNSDTKISSQKLPLRRGYNFKGYFQAVTDTNPMINGEGYFTSAGKTAVSNTLGNETWSAKWENKIIEITLDENAPSGARVKDYGTTAFYVKFADGFYKDANATTPLDVRDNVNVIDIPVVIGYTFDGYEYVNPITHVSEPCTNANGVIHSQFTNTKYDAPITCTAKWTPINCDLKNPDNEYFDEEKNSCQTCPAEYPTATIPLVDKTGCYMTINRYTKYGDAVAEGLTTETKNYDAAYADGVPLSSLTETASPMGYNWNSWHATGNDENALVENTYKLYAPDHLDIYEYYTPKNITYNLFCKDEDTTSFASGTGTFNTAFDIGAYESNLPSTCSDVFDKNEFVTWKCYSTNPNSSVESKNSVIWNTDEGPVNCYAQWEPYVFQVDMYSNATDLINTIYVKYGAGYYKDLEAQTPIVIPDDTKPSRPSYRFQGYCLEPNTQNCTRMIDEFGDINSTEFGTTNARFSKTQTLGAPINLYAVWQFIRSAIELDNDGIYPNGSATKPMEALFIDVDGKNVSVDSHFEPDQIIGNANSNTNIVIPKEYLPTLKIGEQYYAFNGYKHGDTDVVDSNGLILPAGIQEIQNFSQDNPITWVAQWVPIYKVVLKVNQNQGTLGSFTEFYTDKTGVYSDIYLINNNTENNTYIGSVANGTTLLNSAEQYPSRTGYNFAGFDNNISADGKLTSAGAQAIQNFNNPVATWTAQWESKIVKIILTDAIHGTNNNPIWEKYGVGFYDNSSVSGNVINGIPSVPSVEGYTFDGFYPSSSAVEPYITSSGTINMGATTFDGESEEVELYARWTPNQYTVYFDKNGGEGYMEDRQVFTYDTPGNLNTNGYSKTGHTFIGWCVGQTQCETTDTTFKADGAEVINLTTGSGITLYAKWEPITYRIEFSGGANGVCDIATGEGTDYNPITYGSGVTLPRDGCSRTGYNLIGWSLTAGCPSISDSNFIELGGHHADFTTTDNATVMIYACWNGITYTVHFDANGGTGTIPDQTNVSYNAPITLPRGQDLLSKEGHNCVGWCVGTRECENYKADGSSASELTTESEVTLYAKWETSSYNITYMVDGVNTPDVVAENNSYLYSEQEQTKTPTQPTKTGFKFVGWCKTSDVNSATDCSPTITIEARAHEPKTYYAKWEYRNIICQPGYYLPAGSEVCAPCDKDTEPSMNGWCPGTPEGETWHINYNENQGIAQCPAIINDTGAAVVIPDYMVDSRTIDFNGNDLKDVEGDCGAVFVYSNDTRNVGKKVETKLGRNLINSNPIDASYDSSKPLNQNVVWAAANCWYNETSQRYDKCLPADWMGVVCANGYYIPQNKLHTNIASMTTYSEFENICEQAQEEYYTNLYDRHKGDVDATNTMLASKVGVAVVNGGYKDVISNTDELFDSLYKKCRPEYRHTDDRGSWKITDCYAIVEYRNSRDELLYEQEKHEFSGSSNGTIIQADFYHINRAEPDLIANYEFGGWYREKRYRDSQYLVDTSTDLVGDVRLYPYYEQSARSMTIEFRNSVDVPVENIPEPITCFLGDECVYYCGGDGETPCPERNEYDPVAWNLSIYGSGDSFTGEERENGGYKYDLSSIFDYVLLDDHSILYAIWTPTEYQIEYVLKDGEAENPSSYNIKTPTFTLNNPVKQGNTFVGWCVNEDNCADANRYMTYELPNNFVERNKDVPLVMYAMYEPMPYRVDFNENGGEGTKGSIFCRYGEECDVTNYNDVVWEGHEFLGWDRNQNAFTPEFPLGENGKIYVNILTETPNERVALYAIWSRDDIDIRYVYNDESNTVSITTCKMSNGTFNLPVLQNYLRPGYRFFGWRVSDGTDVNDGSQVISYISDYTQDQCYEAGLSWCVSSKRNPLTGVVDITEKCASSCGPNDLEVIPDSN